MNGEQYVNPRAARGIFIPDWAMDLTLSTGALVCYGKLARLAQLRGYAKIRTEVLGELLHVSRRQISDYVKELLDAGMIEYTRTGRASVYVITIRPEMLISREEMERRIREDSEKDGDDAGQLGDLFPGREEQNFTPDENKSSHRYYTENRVRELKKKNKTADKPPSPHQEFIDWWVKEYERVTGEPYLFAKGKDGSVVKELLSRVGADKLRQVASEYLRTTDQFFVRGGRTLSLLRFGWQRFAAGSGAGNDRELTDDEIEQMTGLPIWGKK